MQTIINKRALYSGYFQKRNNFTIIISQPLSYQYSSDTTRQNIKRENLKMIENVPNPSKNFLKLQIQRIFLWDLSKALNLIN